MRRNSARLVTRALVVIVLAGAACFSGWHLSRVVFRQLATTAHSASASAHPNHSAPRTHPAQATQSPPTNPAYPTYSMRVGDLTRTWQEITPGAALPASAPVIVVLSGINAPVSAEIARDDLVPYARADKAELIYPVDYQESWNAGGCCGKAAAAGVNDVAFLKALAGRVDPGHRRPLYVVGYSNGGRLAYRMACDDPGVFDETAIVKADPMKDCALTRPQTVLQVAARDDTAVPFQPGDKGTETPAATVQVARLRATDRCGTAADTTYPGQGDALTLTEWDNCTDGTRVGFAVYSSGGHGFPPATKTQPAAAAVIWSFFTDAKTVAPVPS